MNLPRIFANALARNIAGLLVLMLFAWLGIGTVRAATLTTDSCPNAAAGCTQAEAYAACMIPPAGYTGFFHCREVPNVNRYVRLDQDNSYLGNYSKSWSRQCDDGAIWEPLTNTCTLPPCPSGEVRFPDGECASPCSSRSPSVSGFGYGSLNGTTYCSTGCQWVMNAVGDSNMYRTPTGQQCGSDYKEQCIAQGKIWNSTLSTCSPTPPVCPEGQQKDPFGNCKVPECPNGYSLNEFNVCKPEITECPYGTVKSPTGQCLPGEGQCAAGEARGKDGTCKRDDNNDGTPDEEEEEGDSENKDGKKFSGGDSCDVPPTCSGDPIMCGQARIQWRIDCNTRNDANVSGGACGSVPICTGKNCKAVEYSQLLQQWRTACAVEKLANAGPGEGGNGIADAIANEVNALNALGTGDGHAGVDPNDIWGDNDSASINTGRFGTGGGSCNMTFTIAGNAWAPPSQFWDIFAVIRWIMIACAYVWIAFKLSE